MKFREPKYYIIKKYLLDLINDGILDKGDQVPSETQLMDRFDVSRITARKALEELVNEGYLFKIQGKGSFVRSDTNLQSLTKIKGYTEELKKIGMDVSRIVLQMETIPTNVKKSKELSIPVNSELFVLKRIYLANQVPICLTTAYIPYQLVPNIERINFEENSLYDVLENKYQIKIVNSKLSIEAVAANNDVAVSLKIKRGTPLILFRAITYGVVDGREIPIEYFKTYYNTNYLHYTLDQIR